MSHDVLATLEHHLALGDLLSALNAEHAGYDLVAHWQQGEFHHDIVVRVQRPGTLPGAVLVVAINCNGGVKELQCFEHVPDRYALWHSRCPENPEFTGHLPRPLACYRTIHWVEPASLLAPDTRSELKPACRQRQLGGGYQLLQQ